MAVPEIYIFRLLFVGGGYAHFLVHTGWRGWAEHDREIRGPACSDIASFRESLRIIGDPKVRMVGTNKDYEKWLAFGGWAFVRRDFARQKMPQWLNSKTCIVGSSNVFVDLDLASISAKQHRVGKRRRGAVLARDKKKCMACGRTDRPMTMHHMRGFGTGGETTKSNLVSLCRPCHDGQPTWTDPSFFGLLGGGDFTLMGPSPDPEWWYWHVVNLSSNLMLTRCEVW